MITSNQETNGIKIMSDLEFAQEWEATETPILQVQAGGTLADKIESQKLTEDTCIFLQVQAG